MELVIRVSLSDTEELKERGLCHKHPFPLAFLALQLSSEVGQCLEEAFCNILSAASSANMLSLSK